MKPDAHQATLHQIGQISRDLAAALNKAAEIRSHHGHIAFRLLAASLDIAQAATKFLDEDIAPSSWDYVQESIVSAERNINIARTHARHQLKQDKKSWSE
ncbi:MAG: hypothetical protein ABFS03_03990 [Chloroflexota bacterium]